MYQMRNAELSYEELVTFFTQHGIEVKEAVWQNDHIVLKPTDAVKNTNINVSGGK